MDELNSPANDLYATPTAHGDFLFLASDREGGMGGMDIYRSRVMGRTNFPPVNVGPAMNTADDDTAPTLRAAGFTVVFSSTRDGDAKQKESKPYNLYSSSSRVVFQHHNYSVMPSIGWIWDTYPVELVVILLSLLALIIWAIVSIVRRRRHAKTP